MRLFSNLEVINLMGISQIYYFIVIYSAHLRIWINLIIAAVHWHAAYSCFSSFFGHSVSFSGSPIPLCRCPDTAHSDNLHENHLQISWNLIQICSIAIAHVYSLNGSIYMAERDHIQLNLVWSEYVSYLFYKRRSKFMEKHEIKVAIKIIKKEIIKGTH